ncbi:MAG: muconolactone Delta-isomerase family protein, partial [Actinocrinis sp.]
HPNDPAVRSGQPVSYASQIPEFLTWFAVTVPPGTPPGTAAGLFAGEADRTRELAGQGNLVRLWRLSAEPGVSRALGLWRAVDGARMRTIADSLPLAPWMTTSITPLSRHPSDPAIVED